MPSEHDGKRYKDRKGVVAGSIHYEKSTVDEGASDHGELARTNPTPTPNYFRPLTESLDKSIALLLTLNDIVFNVFMPFQLFFHLLKHR